MFHFGFDLHAPISLNFLKNFKGNYLRLKTSSIMFGMDLKLKIDKVNSFLVDFDKACRIYTKFTHEVNF